MSNINEAKNFIISLVLDPALNSEEITKKTKDSVKQSKIWVERFIRIGDLYRYMNRFNEGEKESEIYNDLKKCNLQTYEDILPEFNERYGYWKDDVTLLNDFVLGESYTSYIISMCARRYNNLKGIVPIKNKTGYEAVIIKANLNNGTYANEWLTEEQHLKYFLESRGDDFDPTFEYNAAIINNPGIPIYTFTRPSNKGSYIFNGIFYFEKLVTEKDQSKWFSFKQEESVNENLTMLDTQFQSTLNEEVKKSQKLSSKERKKRLAQSSKRPPKIIIKSTGYKRNPDVIAEVLDRAKGVCEKCKKEAPFISRAKNAPYLEVHHIEQLSCGGEDSVENAHALCPNCHREAHYG